MSAPSKRQKIIDGLKAQLLELEAEEGEARGAAAAAPTPAAAAGASEDVKVLRGEIAQLTARLEKLEKPAATPAVDEDD